MILGVTAALGGAAEADPGGWFRHVQAQRVATSVAAAAERSAATAERGRNVQGAHLTAARADRDAVTSEGQQALADSDGRVLDEGSREELERWLAHAAAAVGVADLTAAAEEVHTAVVAVDEAVAAWEAEQARLAEEAREAEAEAARKSAGQPAPAPAVAAPVAAPAGTFRDRVAGIAAQYGCGSASIKVDDGRLGSANGSADWYNNAILIRSSTPSERLPYVVAHECVHLKQYSVFAGDVDGLAASMNQIYGGSGFSGLEQNADCVTQSWGFSAWHYTQSCGGARGEAAAAIAGGYRP